MYCVWFENICAYLQSFIHQQELLSNLAMRNSYVFLFSFFEVHIYLEERSNETDDSVQNTFGFWLSISNHVIESEAIVRSENGSWTSDRADDWRAVDDEE